jgi:hypothetical protein
MSDFLTPSPELVQQWVQEATGPNYEETIAAFAAAWGAAREREACLEWLSGWCNRDGNLGDIFQ